ncbi:WXG100 family type VII secretion target [Nocardioides albus]|uniref:Uncharacterized protein YukE n=1 Tax=Nocardioides albus TaxID=1841 RepID=A0A7W5F9N6_9ACTN|nr:hypothetical protein [Nocardioides albus]MBB3090504.1 uncharacterized protein YukE [Nocardioides albus]GGU24388.1 hypothetical protein GCM10007979_23880 [Nocardioides albus]
MSGNELIVAKQDSETWATALGPIESLVGVADAAGRGDWVEASIMGVATALETLGAIADPAGALISAGIGWVIEHMRPFPDWMDQLAGDPDQIRAFADSWRNVSGRIDDCAANFWRSADLAAADWDGMAVSAYRAAVRAQMEVIQGFAKVTDGVAAMVDLAGSIVAGVRELVRDALSQLIGYGISKAAQILSVALAPKAIAEIVAKVAEWAAKIGNFVKGLIRSIRALNGTLDDIMGAIGDAASAVNKVAKSFGDTGMMNSKWNFDELFAGVPMSPGTGMPSISNAGYQVGSGSAKSQAQSDN